MADYNLKAIITGDASGYETAVNKAKKASENLSTSINKISKLMTTAFSVVGISASISSITRFGKECVKSAESANKSLSILNNTLKVTGADAWTTSEDLVKMSEEIAHSTNYTVGEIQDMQSVLLGFKNITGETFRDASDAITDMATVMGMDLKSAVQTVGKALDDPIKGLDSLRRQGFAFTEEQKEQLATLVENGEQLKAQKIILDELNTTYGGSAKSAQSSFDKQKDAVISFKETLGNQLIPVLNVFAEKSATSFSTLTEKIKVIDFSEIAGTVEYSVKVITEYFGVFYNNAKELVKGLTDRFEGVEISMDSVKNAIYNALNNIYKQMQISFGFIKSLINGDWKLAWEYAKIYVLNVCKKILDGLDDLLKKMPDLVNGAIKGLNAYYEAQDKVLLEWFHLPEKWFKAPRLGTYDGKNFIDTSELQKQIDEATKIIEEATGKQVTVNLTSLEKIDEYRVKYQKKTEEGEIHLTTVTQTEGAKRIKEVKNKLKYMLKLVGNYAKEVSKVLNKITKVVKTVLNTIKNLAVSGKNILLKMFDFNIDDALDAILVFEDKILTFFVETLPKMPNFVKSVVQSVKTLLKTLKNIVKREDIANYLYSMIKTIGDNLPEMMEDLLSLLTDLFGGALDGLLAWLNEDGLATLLGVILQIQKALENFVADNLAKIADLLEAHIDDFANFLAESLASANRLLPKLTESLLKIILALIEAITKAFENEDFINSFVESIEQTTDAIMKMLPKLIGSFIRMIFAIINALVPKLPEIILYTVNAVVSAIPEILGEIVSALADVISSIFEKIFTLDFWIDVLSNFGEALGKTLSGGFTSLFGGGSSSSGGGGSSRDNIFEDPFNEGGILDPNPVTNPIMPWNWFADGTENASRGLAIVGEAGPELVRFRGGEQVLNSHNTQKALEGMGGTTINQNVTFNNLQDTTAYAMMNQFKQYNRQMAINGVI